MWLIYIWLTSLTFSSLMATDIILKSSTITHVIILNWNTVERTNQEHIQNKIIIFVSHCKCEIIIFVSHCKCEVIIFVSHCKCEVLLYLFHIASVKLLYLWCYYICEVIIFVSHCRCEVIIFVSHCREWSYYICFRLQGGLHILYLFYIAGWVIIYISLSWIFQLIAWHYLRLKLIHLRIWKT
jgi:hypothetical protein